MTKKLPPPMIVHQGKIIARQTIKTNRGKGFTYNTGTTPTAPSGTAATSGFNVTSATNLTVTGGTGVTYIDGGDLIVGSGGWYDDNPLALEGLFHGLDEEAKKELTSIFGLIKYDENSYEYTLPVIRRIYGEFKFGWDFSECKDSKFSPTPEESEFLINYLRLDIKKVVFLLEKQSKEMLPLLAETYPKLDVEPEFVTLFSSNYVAQVSHKHNINENSDDVHDLFDRLKVIDAYSIDVFDEENIAELGHIEFMHKWNGKIIEFDLTMLHNGDNIIEYFDSESQENGEKIGIKELNKKVLDYVIEKYGLFF